MENKFLKDSLHNLDSSIGGLFLGLENINAISNEMGHIQDEMSNTDKSDVTGMAIHYREIEDKILMIAELLRFTTEDMAEHHKAVEDLKSELFKEFVQKKEPSNLGG